MNASTGVRRSAPASRRAGKAARWRPGVLWLTLVAVLALALTASVGTPFIAGMAIRAALARSFGTGDIAVTARAWPAAALWWGNIDTLSVAARALRIGRLDVAAFDAVLTRVDVDPGQLYGRRELVVRSVGSGFARVMVTAENLARLVAAQPSVKQVAVHLSPGTMVLDGTVSVLGADFPASMAGHLAVRDAAHLDLVVDRVTVMNGLPMPPDVASRFAASINPILDLGSMPFGLRLTKVTIGQGIVMLQAAAGARPLADATP